jgi:hypothetical protein
LPSRSVQVWNMPMKGWPFFTEILTPQAWCCRKIPCSGTGTVARSGILAAQNRSDRIHGPGSSFQNRLRQTFLFTALRSRRPRSLHSASPAGNGRRKAALIRIGRDILWVMRLPTMADWPRGFGIPSSQCHGFRNTLMGSILLGGSSNPWGVRNSLSFKPTWTFPSAIKDPVSLGRKKVLQRRVACPARPVSINLWKLERTKKPEYKDVWLNMGAAYGNRDKIKMTWIMRQIHHPNPFCFSQQISL